MLLPIYHKQDNRSIGDTHKSSSDQIKLLKRWFGWLGNIAASWRWYITVSPPWSSYVSDVFCCSNSDLSLWSETHTVSVVVTPEDSYQFADWHLLVGQTNQTPKLWSMWVGPESWNIKRICDLTRTTRGKNKRNYTETGLTESPGNEKIMIFVCLFLPDLTWSC